MPAKLSPLIVTLNIIYCIQIVDMLEKIKMFALLYLPKPIVNPMITIGNIQCHLKAQFITVMKECFDIPLNGSIKLQIVSFTFHATNRQIL
jgi:hypothetical protein